MAVWDKYKGRNPLRFDAESVAIYEELLDIKPDDRLFRGDPRSGVWVEVDSARDHYGRARPEWFAHMWGFKEAADRLIEDLVAPNATLQKHFLGNPILALYRHSTEIAIKSILITAGVSKEPKALKSHDLAFLWSQAIAAMKEEDSSNAGEEDLKLVGDLIAELNDADKTSQNFRYGVDNALKPYDQKVVYIDVVNLRLVMHKLISALDSCDTWIYETRQAQWEAEAEYRRYEEEANREFEADMRTEYEAAMRDYFGSPEQYVS